MFDHRLKNGLNSLRKAKSLHPATERTDKSLGFPQDMKVKHPWCAAFIFEDVLENMIKLRTPLLEESLTSYSTVLRWKRLKLGG